MEAILQSARKNLCESPKGREKVVRNPAADLFVLAGALAL